MRESATLWVLVFLTPLVQTHLWLHSKKGSLFPYPVLGEIWLKLCDWRKPSIPPKEVIPI
jgi:hypothetical protein